jgi:DnaK suppressor protein
MPVKNKKLSAKVKKKSTSSLLSTSSKKAKAPQKKKLPVKTKTVAKKPAKTKPAAKNTRVAPKKKSVQKAKPPIASKQRKIKVVTKKKVLKKTQASKVVPKNNKKVAKKENVKKPIKNTSKKVLEIVKSVKPVMNTTKKKTAQSSEPKPVMLNFDVANKATPTQVPGNKVAALQTKKTTVPKATPPKAKKAAPLPKHTKYVKRPGAGPAGFLPYEAKTDEEYMNDAQLTHFQHVLHLWKEQLYADRNATTQHMRDDTVNFPDPLDRAALEEEHTLEWRAREREHRLIIKIDLALANIKQGDYGYCEACGAEIGIRRLEARPTATQCIDCKTIHEMRERHTGSME